MYVCIRHCCVYVERTCGWSLGVAKVDGFVGDVTLYFVTLVALSVY